MSQASLDMIENCQLPLNAPILDVGVGTSILIDHLVDSGYTDITAVDISAQAIEKLKARLGNEKSNRVQWLVDDIAHPKKINQLKDIALWHDRAVLHFLHDHEERQTFLATMRKVLRSGGFAIIAAFSLEGAATCSGLPVFRYSKEMLVEFLGDGFELIESFDYLYRQPWGDPRPYVYTRFQKSE
jgi:ubiquinone/menaquinone biosynthesis C-methylase UbiE